MCEFLINKENISNMLINILVTGLITHSTSTSQKQALKI